MKDINLTSMLPFRDDDLLELTDKVLKNETGEYMGIELTTVLPFLSADKVEQLFFSQLEAGKNVSAFYPFLSKKTCHDITMSYLDGSLNIQMDNLYPFLPTEDIKTLFRAVLQKE